MGCSHSRNPDITNTNKINKNAKPLKSSLKKVNSKEDEKNTKKNSENNNNFAFKIHKISFDDNSNSNNNNKSS